MAANANQTERVTQAAGAARVATAAGGGTSVSLRELTRVFGTTKALDGMSLEIAPGVGGRPPARGRPGVRGHCGSPVVWLVS